MDADHVSVFKGLPFTGVVGDEKQVSENVFLLHSLLLYCLMIGVEVKELKMKTNRQT